MINEFLEKNRAWIIGGCFGFIIPVLLTVWSLHGTGQSMAQIRNLIQECEQTQTNCKIIVKGIK